MAYGINISDEQLAVLTDPAHIKIVIAHRNWGKTMLARTAAVQEPATNKVLAVVHNHRLKEFFGRGLNHPGLEIKVGSEWTRFAGYKRDHYDLIVVDEAAQIPWMVMEQLMRNTARMLFLSSWRMIDSGMLPALYATGLHPDLPEWRSWRFRKEDPRMQQELSPMSYRTEWLSEFVTGAEYDRIGRENHEIWQNKAFTPPKWTDSGLY